MQIALPAAGPVTRNKGGRPPGSRDKQPRAKKGSLQKLPLTMVLPARPVATAPPAPATPDVLQSVWCVPLPG
jgi:hypothetical protein